MKLSKAQAEVMSQAKKDIDLARSLDYPEWLKTTNHVFQNDNDNEYWAKRYEEAVSSGYLKEYWEVERKGQVLTHCNSKTLYKLQELGLIEILYDSKGDGGSGIDRVQVLNY